jgi:hypothetical protein
VFSVLVSVLKVGFFVFFGFGFMIGFKTETETEKPLFFGFQCLPPGHGIMIHKGTWHDFPLAIGRPVTCLTANSEKVVKALASMKEPAEMNHGDVEKIEVKKRLGVQVFAYF